MMKGAQVYTRIPAIRGIQNRHLRMPKVQQERRSEKGVSFQSVLEEKLKFSKHAKKRLNSRELSLTEGEVNRLENAIERARSKGARESLVLMDHKAFVVSVKNNTVITAVSQEQLKDSVFTNIDSTVIG